MLNFQFQGNRKLRDEVTSSRLNAILTELRRIRPVAGRGINIQYDGNGSRISALDAPAAPAAGEGPKPWDIYVVESDENGYTVKVRPGTIGNFLATNWDAEFGLDKDTLYYGTATINTDGFGITDIELSMEENDLTPPPAELFAVPSAIPYVFGLFENGKNYRIETNGSVSAPVQQSFVLLKQAAPAPGESPYDIYYNLLQ
jgi:hypothetical protein